MKFFSFFFLSLMFISCVNPLENKYTEISLEKDILALRDLVPEEELVELVEYISLSSSFGVNLVGKTYNELLNEIKVSKLIESKADNSFLIEDFKELLNQRIENHICDDFSLEMNKKGIHNHNDVKNNKISFDDDSYFIDY